MKHARAFQFDYVKIPAILQITIKSRLRSVKKIKGELMHENGFEFEANLKHYQGAVSLLTSLACSIKI